jgi:hypothetical protein
LANILFAVETIPISDEAAARLAAGRQLPVPSGNGATVDWHQFACTDPAEQEELRHIAQRIETEFEQLEPEDAPR